MYWEYSQLVDGANTLKIIENMETNYEAPLKSVVVSDCGEYFFDSESLSRDGKESDGSTGYEDESTFSNSVSDRIDERDVASLIMLDRYQKGLYSLESDNIPSSH